MIFSKGVPLSAKLCFYLLPCRSDALPFDEIKDVYLLDFVGPPGFVNDIAPKVERSAHFYTHYLDLLVVLFLSIL
jgi:hypothetical protein